jgi:transcription initiation factor TFIIIB Brf1 subunit/transcription initiation factor TFIIB
LEQGSKGTRTTDIYRSRLTYEQLKELQAKGLTIGEIAKERKVSVGTVYNKIITMDLASEEIKRASSLLSLPEDAEETAHEVFEKIASAGYLRGRTPRILAIASVLIACRIHRVPRPLRETMNPLQIDRRERRAILKILKSAARTFPPGAAPLSLRDCVLRICEQLNLGHNIREKAESLLKQNSGLSVNPWGLAAAAVYASCDSPDTAVKQAEVSRAACITGPTLRKNLKLIGFERRRTAPETREPFEVTRWKTPA